MPSFVAKQRESPSDLTFLGEGEKTSLVDSAVNVLKEREVP